MGRAFTWVLFAWVLALASWAFAETQAEGLARVRGSSPEISRAIGQLLERSPTFREIVAAIGRTDGVVYVHDGECGRNVLACLLLAVTQAGLKSHPTHQGRPASPWPRFDGGHRS